jgi:phospholipid/cholesterol/gamma-HCH transport system ATP-binding protein
MVTPAGELPAVEFDRVSLAFDDVVVLREVSFRVRPGCMTALMGASGSGKSTVLRLILGLLRPDAGTITINGVRTDLLGEAALIAVRGRIGMLFQENALFDSLTVAGNVGYRLEQELHMPADAVRRRVEEVLEFIGLHDYIDQMPSELSGGQRRRVAIARAIASKPQVVLLDDPTSGLDPIVATTVDNEIIKLRDLEKVTPIVVTHQLPDVFYIAGHEAVRDRDGVRIVPADAAKADEADLIVLRDGRIYFEGRVADLEASVDPYLRTFLVGWIPALV